MSEGHSETHSSGSTKDGFAEQQRELNKTTWEAKGILGKMVTAAGGLWNTAVGESQAIPAGVVAGAIASKAIEIGNPFALALAPVTSAFGAAHEWMTSMQFAPKIEKIIWGAFKALIPVSMVACPVVGAPMAAAGFAAGVGGSALTSLVGSRHRPRI
jgi:hypothetical protein